MTYGNGATVYVRLLLQFLQFIGIIFSEDLQRDQRHRSKSLINLDKVHIIDGLAYLSQQFFKWQLSGTQAIYLVNRQHIA